MNLAPVTLEHGESFGRLRILGCVKTPHGKMYRVGCECGNSRELYRAVELMRGRVKECARCAKHGSNR